MPQLRSRDIFLLGLISGLILAAIGTFWWLDKNSVPATPYVTVLGGSALASAPPTEAVTVPPIVIYLVGAVRQPGVYTLPPTARLVDAIQLAGGFSDDADQEGVNLAMPLKDGLRYYLPRLGELEMAGVAAATGDASGMLTSGSGKININTADQATLEQLPQIGPARAKAIIDYRQRNGLFAAIEDLKKVSGIGNSIFAQLQDLITV